MEVAIPIVGLGAMYLISNQNKEKERDGFIGTQNTSRRLPNTNTAVHNYPVENKNASLLITINDSTVVSSEIRLTKGEQNAIISIS